MTAVPPATDASEFGSHGIEIAIAWTPFLIVLLLTVGFTWFSIATVRRERGLGQERRLPWQVTRAAGVVVLTVLLVALVPIDQIGVITEGTKSQLLALFGIAIAATLSLSSTTIAANVLSGLMLRSMRSFKPGDFIRVGDHFGRVTERGLFHTEIQTEDRDLVSLPHSFIATSPVKVVRSSGTIISAEVGLGYEESNSRIEDVLTRAAEMAGLSDPFVLVISMLDHAVVYRVCGFLSEIKTIVSAKSRLHKYVLDTLHMEGIEIVSPNFMYQRQVGPDQKIIAAMVRAKLREDAQAPEAIVFDKAEAAEKADAIRRLSDLITAQIKRLESGGASDDDTMSSPAEEIELLRTRHAAIAEELEGMLREHDDSGT